MTEQFAITSLEKYNDVVYVDSHVEKVDFHNTHYPGWCTAS